MSPKPFYSAAVCMQCQHSSLVADDGSEPRTCALCGAQRLTVPGAKFVGADRPLFARLEEIVHDADLSKSEATLIAAELERVGLDWEPPELTLQRISPRLRGLDKIFDAKQEYGQLLLIVGMLLTIVCVRMVGRSIAPSPTLRKSGVMRVGEEAAPMQVANPARRKLI